MNTFLVGLYQYREEKSERNKDLYLFTLGKGKNILSA